jgi:hypothetical protein
MRQLDFDVRKISGVRVYPHYDSTLDVAVDIPDVILDAIIDDYELSLSGQLDVLKKYSRLFIVMQELQDTIDELTDELAEEAK